MLYISHLLNHSALQYMNGILILTFTRKLSFRVPSLKICVACIFRNLARRPAKSTDNSLTLLTAWRRIMNSVVDDRVAGTLINHMA